MIPSRRMLAALAILALLGLPLGILSALGEPPSAGWRSLWWGLLLALALLAALDALRLRRTPTPLVERRLPTRLPLGHWSEVRLLVRQHSAAPLSMEIFDHPPAQMDFEQLPRRIHLRPAEHCEFSYRLRPLQRGLFAFARCEIRLSSALGLWHSRRLLALSDSTRVYPDFAQLHSAGLRAVDDWLNRLGVRQQPRRGLGLEFHQLREFREGDTLRQIDWKATARMRTPIAREYQDERDQQILLLLDCGRRMRSQDDQLSHFDHALNASLLLAYAALREGDAVGFSTFASDQPRFLAPAKGQAQLGTLLNGVYDLQCTRQPADFNAAVDQVLVRQHRRALVVVLSNLRDEDDDELFTAMQRLARRHRVLLVSLREEVLSRVQQRPVENLDDALAYCGTLAHLERREALYRRLVAHGLPVLEARPHELGPELVGRYLAWKRAGAL
ncbi:DUF58 domain-containing protein [Stutzerimonas stutzeri]|uniref:DUF58 domain-containing protein n=1 Tax=Stutzerimonas sp. S1 TaxID=3030652 RepID=UPI002224C4FA|nr:DUF58 domain-containing protein [Stutzerimonas sp. S1]MCW3149942.1 DUF58 domain-containing protein [Stutzerimonas sp. S1]